MVNIERLLSTGLVWLSILATSSTAFPASKVETVDIERELQYYGNNDHTYYYGNDHGYGKGGGGGGGGGCSGKLTYFESEVLVTFDGFDEDPGDITRINWDGLEKTFMDSYNSLAYDLCDEYYTRVVDASIGMNSDGEILIKRSGCEYALRFYVQGVCQGCNPNTATLFSPPGQGGGYYRQLISTHGQATNEQMTIDVPVEKRRRRRTKEDKSSKSSKGSSWKGKGKGKGSKAGGDDDDDGGDGPNLGPDIPCDCSSKHPQFRTPTEEEFRVAYDAGIQAFGDSRPHRHGGVAVDYVVKVSEVEDVECSVVEEEFNALISIEFFGDREVVTDEERAVLEENFVWVYNGLQADRCDSPLFRTANLAEIILVSDPDEPQVFLYVFSVTGTCRGEGCSADVTLFAGDSLVRKLSDHLTYQGYNGACQCPLYTMEFGAPTTSEFEVRYFQAVQCEREKGRLVNIDASGEVVELGQDFTPFPTDFPVDAPSTGTPVSGEPTKAPVTLAPGETFPPTPEDAPSITIPPVSLPPGESNAPSLDPTALDDSRAPSFAPSPISTGVSEPPSVSEEPSSSEDSEAPSVSSEPSGGDDEESEAPSVSDEPSVSSEPTGGDDEESEAPSVSDEPSVSSEPSGGDDEESEAPSVSDEPSVSSEPTGGDDEESEAPSVSDAPSTSAEPSVSNAPDGGADPGPGGDSEAPSVSDAPSTSAEPSVSNAPDGGAAPGPGGDSEAPSISDAPSTSAEPSVSNAPDGGANPGPGGDSEAPSVSNAPSTSAKPSVSNAPDAGADPGPGGNSQAPSVSDAPSTSAEPSVSKSPSQEEASQ
jgi:hypothetical protein